MKRDTNGFAISPIAYLAENAQINEQNEDKRLYEIDKLNNFAIDFFNCYTEGKTAYVKGIFRVGLTDYLNRKGIFKKMINGEWQIVIDQGSVIKILQLHDLYKVFDQYFDEQGEYYNYNDGKVHITEPIKTIVLREIYLINKDQIINKNLVHTLTEHSKEFLSATSEIAYFVFENWIVEAKATGVQLLSYEDLLTNKCILASSIIHHILVYPPHNAMSDYELFIKNVFPEQEQAARTSIGYLLHNYNNQASMKIVLMYDEAITSKSSPEGRTGKGLYADALSRITSLERIDGKRIQTDKFSLEKVTHNTRIVFIDDARKDFDIDTLNSSSTEGLSFNRKFKSEVYFTKANTPKILISSNHILATEGKTRAHRQYILEFGDYYSSKATTSSSTPVKDVHGKTFFEDWNEEEWNLFYSYMIDSTQLYLANGLIQASLKNVHENRLRQTTSSEALDWINIYDWKLNLDYSSKMLYEEFIESVGSLVTTQRGFTETLKKFAENKGWKFISLKHTKFKLIEN